MKLKTFLYPSAAVALSSLLFCTTPSTGYANTPTVYVTVRESKLKSRPEFLAPVTTGVRYGDSLTVESEDEAWLKVKATGGKNGYIHRSAISQRQVVLSSSKSFSPSTVSDNDVVLAGKGFNAQVEKEYAAKNRSLNFKDVDAMEAIKIAPKDLAAFIQSGKLG